jgi:MFS transporter, putative metabolite:H+ symporter
MSVLVGSAPLSRNVVRTTVVVAALGYFVDVYDLVLFSIVRIPSLKGIGVPDAQLLPVGVTLLNLQMIGVVAGGLLWGVFADKRGRRSVLFGSILLYSAANIANAYVTSVPMYAVLRLLAGLGLAGELGAAVTLVSEIMGKHERGWGTTIIASVGLCGALFAVMVGDLLAWKAAYLVGGLMGLMLLVLRIGVLESGLFGDVRALPISRGNLLMLVRPRRRLLRFVECMLIGVPIWFVLGLLITFSPEIARELHVAGAVSAAKAVFYCYIGLALGDFTSGLLSQLMRSRKKVLYLFLTFTTVLVAAYALSRGASLRHFYAICLLLGVGIGYWAVFVSMASEQFGTNLRGTVTTSVPNFVRGAVVPMTLLLGTLRLHFTLLGSVLIVGGATLVLAYLSLFAIGESFARDLDFVEEA